MTIPPPRTTEEVVTMAAVADEGVPSPSDLHLYTAVQMLAGRSVSSGRRLSDLMNHRDTEFLTLAAAQLFDLLENGEPSAQVEHLTIRKAAVQLAIPSDPLDLFRVRVPTQIVGIEVATSFFRVIGNLHRTVTDPANLEAFLSGHSRRFLAISQATIKCLPNPRFDTQATTVLINTEHVHCWWITSDHP
jgi:hypothetical protein